MQARHVYTEQEKELVRNLPVAEAARRLGLTKTSVSAMRVRMRRNGEQLPAAGNAKPAACDRKTFTEEEKAIAVCGTIKEAAKRLGRKPKSIQMYRYRNGFPAAGLATPPSKSIAKVPAAPVAEQPTIPTLTINGPERVEVVFQSNGHMRGAIVVSAEGVQVRMPNGRKELLRRVVPWDFLAQFAKIV